MNPELRPGKNKTESMLSTNPLPSELWALASLKWEHGYTWAQLEFLYGVTRKALRRRLARPVGTAPARYGSRVPKGQRIGSHV